MMLVSSFEEVRGVSLGLSLSLGSAHAKFSEAEKNKHGQTQNFDTFNLHKKKPEIYEFFNIYYFGQPQ